MLFLMLPLTASNPYTTSVDFALLLIIGAGFGWLVDRLVWPVFGEQSIEQRVSTTFRMLQDMSDRAFHPVEPSDEHLTTLAAQVDDSLRATAKALKVVTMTGSLSPSEQSEWAQAIALQSELLAHLLAISRLLQENQENPLLHELAPELSALGDSLSATFAGLSAAIVSKPSTIQLPNPTVAFQRWQTRLRSMRSVGATQSFDLSSRIAVGLLEHNLEGLVTDLSKNLAWVGARYSAVSADLPIVLNPAQ
jgi:F0F1-type ATP synthase assembly protein I